MNIGIIGTGSIAGKLADAINRVDGANLYGVASRKIEKAREFAEKHNSTLWFEGYEDLYNCHEIDLVYIATPNNFHKKNTIDALNSGKAVLCEKPFALDANDSREMFNLAKDKGLLLVEAMWTKYFPAVKRLKEVIDSGAIGDIVTIHGDLSYPMGESKERLMKKELGGGALLDLGVYPITLVHYLLGKPDSIVASATMTNSGVDESTYAILKYNSGAQGIISTSFDAVSTKEFLVCGTKGWIRLNDNLGFPQSISCYIDGVGEDHKQFPWPHLGYEYQVQGVLEDFNNGLKESSTVKVKDTLEIMEILDEVRGIIGLDFNG